MTDAAIRAAWNEHKDTVFRFAWRMAGSQPVAEDVRQGVFLSLVRAPERFDAQNPGSAGPGR